MIKVSTISTKVTLVLVCTTFLLTAVFGMDAPTNEYGVRDLISAGVISTSKTFSHKLPNGQIVAKKVVVLNQEALLVATAKVDTTKHRSPLYLTVDIARAGGSCGPFDFVFRNDCEAPKTDQRVNANRVVRLRNSYLHIFKLPPRWNNLRITAPDYIDRHNRHCRYSKTAFLHVGAPNRRCSSGDYTYRHCRKRFLIGKKCRDRDCESLVFMTRLATYDGGETSLKPYVASDGGFKVCPDHAINNLFLK